MKQIHTRNGPLTSLCSFIKHLL